MRRVPIEGALKNAGQIGKARLQDIAVAALYNVDQTAVLHGGTAIWRCYAGNRFSDDLDIYLRSTKRIEAVRNGLAFSLSRVGAWIAGSSAIGNSTVIVVEAEGSRVKLEFGLPKGRIRPIAKNYERTDGTFTTVLTLSAEDFIVEKMDTYMSRRYMRDMYDIFHLAGMAEKSSGLRRKVCAFINSAQDPVNEDSLKAIVYSGAVPSYEDIVAEIKRVFCESD